MSGVNWDCPGSRSGAHDLYVQGDYLPGDGVFELSEEATRLITRVAEFYGVNAAKHHGDYMRLDDVPNKYAGEIDVLMAAIVNSPGMLVPGKYQRSSPGRWASAESRLRRNNLGLSGDSHRADAEYLRGTV